MLAMSQRPLSPEEAITQARTEVEAQHHLAREFEKEEEEPSDDLISLIVHAHQDEEPLLWKNCRTLCIN